MKHAFIAALMAALQTSGGFSFDARMSRPASGYMVATPDSETVLEVADPEKFSEFAYAYLEKAREAGGYFGAWKDEKTGRVFLDISRRFDDLEAAKQAGAAWKQLAIYDLSQHKSVYLA